MDTPQTVGEHIAACFVVLFKAQTGQVVTEAELQAADDSITALKTSTDAQFAALGARLTTDEGQFAGFASAADLTALSAKVDAITAPDLSGLASKADLDALTTKVDGLAAPDLSGLAQETEVTALTGRVTQLESDFTAISTTLDGLTPPPAAA